nr:hypothetical protein 9 [Legionellales bacterium]
MAKLRSLIREEKRIVEDKEFLRVISRYNDFGKHIYKEDELKSIAEVIEKLVEEVENYTLNETEAWFDKVTVKRNIKTLKEASKGFIKTVNEMNTLQQRLVGSYEDIGIVLDRYFDVKGVEEGLTESAEVIDNTSVTWTAAGLQFRKGAKVLCNINGTENVMKLKKFLSRGR